VKHRAEHGWDGALLAVGHNAGGASATGACRTVRERGTFTPLLQIIDCSPLDLVTDPAAEHARTRRPPISPWSACPGSPPTSLYCCPPWSSRRGRRLRRGTGRIRSPRGPPHGRRTARDRPLRPRPDGRTTPHSLHRQGVTSGAHPHADFTDWETSVGSAGCGGASCTPGSASRCPAPASPTPRSVPGPAPETFVLQPARARTGQAVTERFGEAPLQALDLHVRFPLAPHQPAIHHPHPRGGGRRGRGPW